MREYPRAMAVVGRKNSGKTTLMVELLKELSARGLRVGAVKFSHHSLDRADRDTGRLAKHAAAVVGMAPGETSLFLKRERSIQQMIPWMGIDVVLVEGGKALTSLPRVLIGEEVEKDSELLPELALGVWKSGAGRLPVLGSVRELADLVLERGFLLPELNCEACGRKSCADMARDIVANAALPSACQAMRTELKITVNGEPVALGPFVQRLLASTLNGMLRELKGYTSGRVTITMDQ